MKHLKRFKLFESIEYNQIDDIMQTMVDDYGFEPEDRSFIDYPIDWDNTEGDTTKKDIKAIITFRSSDKITVDDTFLKQFKLVNTKASSIGLDMLIDYIEFDDYQQINGNRRIPYDTFINWLQDYKSLYITHCILKFTTKIYS